MLHIHHINHHIHNRSTSLVRDYVAALETKLVDSTLDLTGRINLLQERADDSMEQIRSLQQHNAELCSTVQRTARHIAVSVGNKHLHQIRLHKISQVVISDEMSVLRIICVGK